MALFLCTFAPIILKNHFVTFSILGNQLRAEVCLTQKTVKLSDIYEFEDFSYIKVLRTGEQYYV